VIITEPCWNDDGDEMDGRSTSSPPMLLRPSNCAVSLATLKIPVIIWAFGAFGGFGQTLKRNGSTFPRVPVKFNIDPIGTQ